MSLPYTPGSRVSIFPTPPSLYSSGQTGDATPRPRPFGSHDPVESTRAKESRCDGVVLRVNPPIQQLVETPQLLHRNHEHDLSTRDRPARTGADARIEDPAAIGEVRLAVRHDGSRISGPSANDRE